MKGTVGIVDDQQLFLKSVGMYVNSFPNFDVTLYAVDGPDLLAKLRSQPTPDILLIDVNMPQEEGYEVAAKVKAAYPSVKMVGFSMMEDAGNVMRMIRAGCCAYLVKNIDPMELEVALTEILNKGFYNSFVTNLYNQEQSKNLSINLKDRELQFLQLACTDLTYQEIAAKMFLSIKTVDGYRAMLFEKFQVKSRVGLVMAALKHNLISV